MPCPVVLPNLHESVVANHFKSIPNFRDVGLSINRSCGTTRLCEGKVYRSARIDDEPFAEKEKMVAECGLTTIIDLRSESEHVKQAPKHVDKVPGVRYEEINLNGGAFERALLWRLGWGGLTKFISLLAFGYRNEAVILLGRDVVQPRGVIGLGKDSIDICGSELFRVFDLLAEPKNYPVLIHCTQGKDRTGLTVMLLLLLLDVPVAAIAADYVASEKELHCERESRIKELREYGLGNDFADCPRSFVVEVSHHIDTTYGGIYEYFDHIGVGKEMQDGVRSAMLREYARLIPI